MKKKRQREPAEVRRMREQMEAAQKRREVDKVVIDNLHRQLDEFEAKHKDEIEAEKMKEEAGRS